MRNDNRGLQGTECWQRGTNARGHFVRRECSSKQECDCDLAECKAEDSNNHRAASNVINGQHAIPQSDWRGCLPVNEFGGPFRGVRSPPWFDTLREEASAQSSTGDARTTTNRRTCMRIHLFKCVLHMFTV